jgi:hypothetical protein
MAEEKNGDRTFRKEFTEGGEHLDYLYKLFRTRKVTEEKKKEHVEDADTAENDGKPKTLEAILYPYPTLEEVHAVQYMELLSMQMPESMAVEVWDNFIARRNAQIVKEQVWNFFICLI